MTRFHLKADSENFMSSAGRSRCRRDRQRQLNPQSDEGRRISQTGAQTTIDYKPVVYLIGYAPVGDSAWLQTAAAEASELDRPAWRSKETAGSPALEA